MNKKKIDKNFGLKNIQNLVNKKIKLDKLKINPIDVVEETKNKIGNLYDNFKKDREREKIKAEKKRKAEKIKELQNQKKQQTIQKRTEIISKQQY